MTRASPINFPIICGQVHNIKEQCLTNHHLGFHPHLVRILISCWPMSTSRAKEAESLLPGLDVPHSSFLTTLFSLESSTVKVKIQEARLLPFLKEQSLNYAVNKPDFRLRSGGGDRCEQSFSTRHLLKLTPACTNLSVIPAKCITLSHKEVCLCMHMQKLYLAIWQGNFLIVCRKLLTALRCFGSARNRGTLRESDL